MRSYYKDTESTWKPYEEKALSYLESIEALDKLDEYLEEAESRVNE